MPRLLQEPIALSVHKPSEAQERFGADDAVVTQNYKPIEFARLISKIAYSFAFAERADGLLRYEASPIVRAILGETEDVGHWVGTYTDPLEAGPREHMHEVTIVQREDRHWLEGQVKLFADAPSPLYGAILS